MPGPILWGPNSKGLNLQNGFINGTNSQWISNDGPKNYAVNPQVETGTTTGYSLGTVTLTSNLPTGVPTFGSGASGNLSLSATSTAPLAGAYSLSYVSSAATTAGNFVATDPLVIDVEDYQKVLNFSITYKATSNGTNANWSGTTANSFAVAVYDVTNSAWIIPTGVFNFIANGSAGAGKCTGSFQASSTGVSYRLVIYNANASAGAITVYFDDFFVGPSSVSSSSGAVIAWNGTQVTQGVTANVTDIAFTTNYDSSGAWNGTQYVVPAAGHYLVSGGVLASGGGGASVYLNGSVYKNSLWSTANTSSQASAGATLITNAKPGDLISLRFSASVTLTVSSFSVCQVQNTGVGAAGQVVASRAKVSAGASTSASNPINFDSIDFDTTGSITTGTTTWKYTCPVSGIYRVSSNFYFGAGGINPALYKNGSIYAGFMNANSNPGAGSTTVQCNAGDTLDFRPNNATGTPTAYTNVTVPQGNYIDIALLSGPSASQASSPTVAASYWVSANFAISSTIPCNFDSKEYDTTNSVTTSATAWKFTAPISGYYSIKIYAVATAAGAAQLILYKNGSAYKGLAAENANTAIMAAATSVYLNANDFIDVRSGGTPTITGGTLASGLAGTIAIEKIG